MFDKKSSIPGRWCGIAASAILLALCLIFLNSQPAAAQAAPATLPVPMQRSESVAPGSLTIEMESHSPDGLPPLNAGLTVDLVYNTVGGLVAPGDRVTVTRTADGAYGAAEADGVGSFWTSLWLPSGQPADVVPGDSLLVSVNGGPAATLSPLAITGQVDVLADQVSGNIAGLGAGVAVTVTLGDLGSLIADEPQVIAFTDASGNFDADFSGVADIGPAMMALVQYHDGSGTVQSFLYPSHVFRVTGWDAVEGYATPGSPVTVTVYSSYPDSVRWSAQTTAGWPHGIYGYYASNEGNSIEYDDIVEVDLGSGVVLSVTAKFLALQPNAATDEISGWVEPGTHVRGYIWDSFDALYDEASTTVDFTAHFTLTFSADLQTAHWPFVGFADADGDEVGYSAPPPHIRAYPVWSALYAVADGPNQPVTYTLQTAQGTFTQPASCGKTNTCDFVSFDSVQPGDVITAEFTDFTMEMTVADVSLEPDTANDAVTGDGPPGRLDVTICQYQGGGYPGRGCGLATTTISSPFVVPLPGFDVRDGMSDFYAYYYDAVDGNRTLIWRGAYETAYFEVLPWGIGGVAPHADEQVTAYIYDSDGTTLLTSTSEDYDGDPWGFWLGNLSGYYIQPGYWVTVTSDSGWQAGLQVPSVTVEADAASDLIWGEAPKSQVFVEHSWADGWDGRWVPVDGYVLDRAFFGGDLQYGDRVSTTYQAPNGDRVRTELFWPHVRMDVNYGHQWVEVETVPGTTVTVTVAGKATISGQADASGWFRTYDWSWDPQQPTLEPGDVITATALGLEATVHPMGAIDAVVDSNANLVSGTVQAPWFPTVTVSCEVWGPDGQNIVIASVDGDGGTFQCDFGAIGVELVPGGPSVMVRYWEPDGDSVINEAQFLDLMMNVNYGHDWVEGNYMPGHTVWITVTESDQVTVKATAELHTQIIPWWGGRTGFSTNLEDAWVPSRPDIEPGDYVFGWVDTGYAGSVRVGTITGDLDIEANTISGQVFAGWFSEPLDAACGVWAENGPNLNFTVDPAGGSYFCDFTPFDVLPGQDVYVQYKEPDGDWVYNVFREAAPNMRVEKWAEGSGQASPGGPVVFTLRYRNDGDATADVVYLTDTLPANTTYVADTSGLGATVIGDQVVWTFGPVAPGEEAQFQIVLTNTANAGDTLVNQADIWALYDQDTGNNHAEAQVEVVAGQPDLYVNKNPNPGDPAQGQTMLWEINYGNNGPVASGPAIITDVLPLDTSIVGWISENGYNLWTDHSTASELVLEAPSIPGNWGDRLLLRLLVSASTGTQLTNTVEIATADDSDPGNNWHQRNDVWVGEPRWDAYVDKNLGWGTLVAGGQVEYNVHVQNNGNMATAAVLTDSLPEGTSFNQAQTCTGPVCEPFPPDYVDNQMAVWDLGTLEPGQWIDMNVRLDIDGDATPGTVLTNCAEVAIDGDDNWPYNNSDCVVDSLYNPGPNLRIEKYYWWNGQGQIEYEVDFKNVGTTTLNDVTITDTLADGTTFNGNWWHWFWEGIGFSQVGDQLIWTIDHLDPTWSSALRYQVDIDGDLVGQGGLCFTNVATAPMTGDVYPQDNTDEVVACTGPDIYAKKWLNGGEPRLGDIVTFTVEFGQLQNDPWCPDPGYGTHITETLPAGMEFITATAPWDASQPWEPESWEGNTVVWAMGDLGCNNWWQFDVLARIVGPVDDGDVLVNTVAARGDSPNDVEADYGNNVFELPVTVLAPQLAVTKSYESSSIGGSVVTYTLTVANTGSTEATNVVLSDTLPAGLTYGGGGSFDGTDVTWSIASIASGDTAEVSFWATLPAEGIVVNDSYRVTASDQGSTSAFGPAVSLTVTPAGFNLYLPIVLRKSTP